MPKKERTMEFASKAEQRRYQMATELFDVVIFDMESRKVESVVGKALRRNAGTYNAEQRLETALNRINLDRYSAEIVPAGKYDIGSTLPESP